MGRVSKKTSLNLYCLSFVCLCLLTGYLYTLPVSSGAGFLYQRFYSNAFLVLMFSGLFVFIKLIGNEDKFNLVFSLKVLFAMMFTVAFMSSTAISDLTYGQVSETYDISEVCFREQAISQAVIRYDLVISGEPYRLTAEHHTYLADAEIKGRRLKLGYYPKTKVVCDVEILE